MKSAAADEFRRLASMTSTSTPNEEHDIYQAKGADGDYNGDGGSSGGWSEGKGHYSLLFWESNLEFNDLGNGSSTTTSDWEINVQR